MPGHPVKALIRTLLRTEEARFFDSPVFVVGCGRSGTSAMCNALGRHPAILMAAPEAPLIAALGRAAADYTAGNHAEYVRGSIGLKPDDLRADLRRLCIQSALGPEFALSYGSVGRKNSVYGCTRRLRHWGAKIFPREYAAIGLIWLFPWTRFVYIHRNGLDVVHSMGRFESFARLTFEQRCQRWANSVAHYEYLRHTDIAATVRFEEFVENPAAQFERIFRLLEVPSDPRPAEYASGTVVHPLGEATRKTDPKTYFDSRPNGWSEWSDEQKKTFRKICGEAMRTLGYPMPF